MERADAIDKLKRKGQFPAHFVEKYPTQSQIILSMMNKDPCLRPTALEILSSDLFQKRYIVPDNNTVVHNREMAELRDQYTQMKNEKEELQRRLDEIEAKLNQCDIQHDEQPDYHQDTKSHSTLVDVKSEGITRHISKMLFTSQ